MSLLFLIRFNNAHYSLKYFRILSYIEIFFHVNNIPQELKNISNPLCTPLTEGMTTLIRAPPCADTYFTIAHKMTTHYNPPPRKPHLFLFFYTHPENHEEIVLKKK